MAFLSTAQVGKISVSMGNIHYARALFYLSLFAGSLLLLIVETVEFLLLLGFGRRRRT